MASAPAFTGTCQNVLGFLLTIAFANVQCRCFRQTRRHRGALV